MYQLLLYTVAMNLIYMMIIKKVWFRSAERKTIQINSHFAFRKGREKCGTATA
jgi:hypothetical protein